MARRSEHSLEEIREMVLNAAKTIVIEEGFRALKVRKIAMEIGYTVGSIYMVFANMADLIMHVKGDTLDAIDLQLSQVDTTGDPQQCILALVKKYLDFANTNFNQWSMIFEHRLPDDEATPEWYQNKIDNLFKPLEKQISRLTPSASEIQTKRAARAIWGGIHGICMLSVTGKLDRVGSDDVEETIVLLVENFLRGWQEHE